MLVQITCYHNRVWLYIISTNTKMFKNPKWITFDILGLCNQLLATQLIQRAIQLFNDLQPNTILIDRVRSLAIISSSKCTIQDPLNGDHFQFQDRVLSVWWSFIFEHDRWMDCVRWSRLDRRWSEDGPRADAIMGILGTMQKCELFYWLADCATSCLQFDGNELFQSEQ